MMVKETAMLMFGVQGTELSKQEIKWLQHPLSAGVILFSRNYESLEQLKDLIAAIREKAGSPILISVDHEGGRVQRFREGFTQLPAMAEIGKIYNQSKELAIKAAKDAAIVLGYELRRYDIDFSFAPVLDLQSLISKIIADRSFHEDPLILSELAVSFYQGLKEVGFSAVGKHFPGHGRVLADSHLELPIATFSWEELWENDLLPFKVLIDNGIEAIMPAHILYNQVDGIPAGFSNFWLENILRQKLNFNGCIISDDLDMAGAAVFGSILERLQLAKQNCDLILICNHEPHIERVLMSEKPKADLLRQKRISQLFTKAQLVSDDAYQAARKDLQNLKLI